MAVVTAHLEETDADGSVVGYVGVVDAGGLQGQQDQWRQKRRKGAGDARI
jgi:hypothetical protein